jgi:hypothetical protein
MRNLPFGSRGGMSGHYDFPVDGEYLIKGSPQGSIRITSRAWDGRSSSNVRLDGKLLKRFTVGGAAKVALRHPVTPAMAKWICRRSRVGNLHAVTGDAGVWKSTFQ